MPAKDPLGQPEGSNNVRHLQDRLKVCSALSYALSRRRYPASCAVRPLRSTSKAATCRANGLNRSRVAGERTPQSLRISSSLLPQSPSIALHLLSSPPGLPPPTRGLGSRGLRSVPHSGGTGNGKALLPCPPWGGVPSSLLYIRGRGPLWPTSPPPRATCCHLGGWT